MGDESRRRKHSVESPQSITAAGAAEPRRRGAAPPQSSVASAPQSKDSDPRLYRYPASNSIFRSVDRLKLIQGIMEADPKKKGCALVLKELVAKGACLAIYPLHDDDELQTIQDRWLTYSEPPWKQPISMVKDYFGEKVGMYFLFIGSYTTWLMYACIIGLGAYAMEMMGGASELWSTALCGVFMSLWTTLFLENWKGEEARAKLEWGMTGFEETEEDRTEFEGREIHSPVTGLPDTFFPAWEKTKRMASSYLQILLCMVYVSCVNAGVFYMHAYVSRWPLAQHLELHYFLTGPFSVPTVLTNIVLALVIQFTNGHFMQFARRRAGESTAPTFSKDGSRQRRDRHVDIRGDGSPRPRRGCSVETVSRRRRGRDVDIPRRRVDAAATWIFRGDGSRRRRSWIFS